MWCILFSISGISTKYFFYFCKLLRFDSIIDSNWGTISVLISLIVSLQTILNGFQNTDKLKIKLLKTFNASKLDILINVVLKENKSVILNTLKINISMCLIGVITGEFLTSKSGLGYLILYGTQVFDLNLVMSSLFILLIISFILYKIVILLIKK